MRSTEGTSLRAVVTGAVLLLAAAILVVTILVQSFVDRQRDAMREGELRALRMRADTSAHLVALLNQEVGLRGFLGSGKEIFLEPYELGLRQEGDALVALRTDVVGSSGAAKDRLQELADLASAWHREVAEPEILERRAGPLPELAGALVAGKHRFDAIRAAGEALRAELDAEASTTLEQNRAAVDRAKLVEYGVLGLIVVVAGLVVAWILRNTVRPIARLADAAESGGFVRHVDDLKLRELRVLGDALVRLESSVRDREATLLRERGDADALRQFVEVVQQITDESEIVATLARTLTRRFDARAVRVLRKSPSENRLDPLSPEMDVDERRRFPILLDPSRCRCIRTGNAVRYDDARAETACDCALGVPQTGSYLCMPMLAAGEIIGLVNVQSEVNAAWSTEAKARMESYVAAASVAMSALSLLRAARESALRDGLTGAYNRRFLAEYLPKQLAQSERRGAALSALMVDIDHFKRFNDAFGHETGDRVLVAFARCLARSVRGSDVVVRYGGEEFAIALPDTRAEDAAILAERLRLAVAAITLDDPRLAITASVGVASYPSHANDAEGLLRAADVALYQAKTAGRNRVMVAEPRGSGRPAKGETAAAR